MDPFATTYFNCGPSTHDYIPCDNDAGTGPLGYDRGSANFAGFTTSPQSWYNTHRASDPGHFTRPNLPIEDSLDLSRFDLLARSAVSNLQVQDVIKPEHNTPWVGPQENRVQRESHSRPSLHRSAYAKSEPLLRPDVYSEAADSGYVSHWPGVQAPANHFSMNTHELEQDYQTLPDAVSPTGGADNQSTVSDGRLISSAKQRKGKRPLTRCPQCGRQPRNLSDSKKHALTHTKPYRCTEPDCTRKDGFATENDLQRHRKSVHNLLPTVGSPAGYICAACIPEVDTPSKFWPRRDNFKAHIKRKHLNHHEATLIEASRRRLRPGDDRAMHADPRPVRSIMRSAQQSQIDSNETSYEPSGSLGLPVEASLQSQRGGIFGPGCSSTIPNEQALVGHMVDQFGNGPINPTGHVNRSMGGYTNEPAEADFYGNDPSRLLSALSEAAEHLDYSATPSFVPAPGRSRIHPPSSYASTDLRFKAPSPHGRFSCQYPGCSEVMVHECSIPYGPSISSLTPW